jgi:hypothetical protein
MEMIDVWCGDETLPTAKCIFGGDLAYANASADEAPEKLFIALLDALAASRAAKARKDVYWYRGRVDAWRVPKRKAPAGGDLRTGA